MSSPPWFDLNPRERAQRDSGELSPPVPSGLPISETTGVTVELAPDMNTDNTSLQNTLTYPAGSHLPVLSVQQEGDAFPRLVFYNGPGDGIYLSDGTVNAYETGEGGNLYIDVVNNVPNVLTISGNPGLLLESDGTSGLTLQALGGGHVVVPNSDLEIGATHGLVITDQSDGHTYRIICTAGVLSTVQVT